MSKGTLRTPALTAEGVRGWKVELGGLTVLNYCESAPECLERHVIRVLDYIGAEDHRGLGWIYLTDCLDADWYRDANPPSGEPLMGWYVGGSKAESPQIVLDIAQVLGGLPRCLSWTPAATVLIARTLAQEMGHHVASMAGIPFRGEAIEEKAAARYCAEVLIKMEEQRRYRFGAWLLKRFGDRQLAIGVGCWRRGDYEKAKLHFGFAANLWTTHGDPYAWYDLARERCGLARLSSGPDHTDKDQQV